MVTSPNLLTEADPSELIFRTFPAGDGGSTQGCAPVSGDIAEEGGVLWLGNATLLYLFR
eukprot:SAG31_NODE_30380_length_382_cov_0.597173_1_plen_58_part_01